MRRPISIFLLGLMILVNTCPVIAADRLVSLDHWSYGAMTELREAGLLTDDYPDSWIAAGHALTRYEIAYYLRTAVLNYLEQYAGTGRTETLPQQVEITFRRLVMEFQPELRALGVDMDQVYNEQPTFVDFDAIASVLGQRPEVPPVVSPGLGGEDNGAVIGEEGELTLTTSADYAARNSPAGLLLAGSSTRSNDPINMAGEVLGLGWRLGLEEESYQEVFGLSLNIDGYMLADEQSGMQGRVALTLGDELGLGLDALWCLDLDQAMDRFLLDVSTKVEINHYVGVFGGISLDYQRIDEMESGFDSRANAGVRLSLGEGNYLFAGYSYVNPFETSGPHSHETTVALNLGEIGLFLLGLRTTDFTNFSGLELTGEFIYRF